MIEAKLSKYLTRKFAYFRLEGRTYLRMMFRGQLWNTSAVYERLKQITFVNGRSAFSI